MGDWARLAAEHPRYADLAKKYQKPGPRRMLALDGGGIRGVITLQVLRKIEDQLKDITKSGEEFRLGDYFHYIAGTSTGAIIAACLAYGMTVAEIAEFYDSMGKEMFQKSWFWKKPYATYDAMPLTQQLKSIFVEADGEPALLGSGRLRCLLMCVLRNVTTDSPWPVSSNPFARYNLGDETDDPERRRAYENSNLSVPLYQLVRGSTAAPTFFEPEVIRVGGRKTGDKPPKFEDEQFKFEDGGVTPYNNPAFLLYRMATIPQYRVAWETGEEKLLLISVGTGASPRLDSTFGANFILKNASLIPNALMYGALVDQDINCRMSGRCVHGAPIDSELHDMVVPAAGGGGPEGPKFTPPPGRERAFTYARYNAELSEKWFAQHGFKGLDPAVVGQLDSTDHIKDLRAIGGEVAKEVDLGDAARFDPRLWG